MKTKRTAPPRRRISFAVDRDEIEINSDWVEAVMASPIPVPTAPFPAPPSDVPLIPEQPISEAEGPDKAVFFAVDAKNATEAESTTGAGCTPVANVASVDQTAPVENFVAVAENAPVAQSPPVAESASVVNNNPVELLTTVAVDTTGFLPAHSTVEEPAYIASVATGALSTTVDDNATVAIPSATKDHRIPKRRAILRITDGLTPGQYSVYSLMYEAGERASETARIYKGGYADLCRLTGLSKRGIQNVVAELQEKQVIRLHQQPGYHRTQTSAYLIPESAEVLKMWFSLGWRYALGKSKTLTA
jgi:hypothetical protein